MMAEREYGSLADQLLGCVCHGRLGRADGAKAKHGRDGRGTPKEPGNSDAKGRVTSHPVPNLESAFGVFRELYVIERLRCV